MGDGYSGSLYWQQELKKSALSPTPTKAKGKDAYTVTAESGRYRDYTTAAARNQEGRNGNE